MLRWGKNNEAYLNCWYGPYPKHSKWKKPITYQWGHWVQTFLWSKQRINFLTSCLAITPPHDDEERHYLIILSVLNVC